MSASFFVVVCLFLIFASVSHPLELLILHQKRHRNTDAYPMKRVLTLETVMQNAHFLSDRKQHLILAFFTSQKAIEQQNYGAFLGRKLPQSCFMHIKKSHLYCEHKFLRLKLTIIISKLYICVLQHMIIIIQ